MWEEVCWIDQKSRTMSRKLLLVVVNFIFSFFLNESSLRQSLISIPNWEENLYFEDNSISISCSRKIPVIYPQLF